MRELSTYLAGEQLYGDNFGPKDIQAWYEDEAEGYSSLGASNREKYAYGYHALNAFHAYRYLPRRPLGSVLGFGSAYGDELIPLLADAERLVIVDPSAAFTQAEIAGKPVEYVKPGEGGRIPLDSGVFDLITCLGVLHHIPNVSYVVRELSRVLRPSGLILIREPIVSMGDWSKPRRGLTKRERGIPLHILTRILQDSGLSVLQLRLCMFPTTTRLFRWLKGGPYNNAFATWFDWLTCLAFQWNLNYHPVSPIHRLRPTAACLIAQKHSAGATAR